MPQTVSIKLTAEEAHNQTVLTRLFSMALGCQPAHITGFYPIKQSLDARSRTVWVSLTAVVFVNEPFTGRPAMQPSPKEVGHSPKTVVIVGAGPAGLFAALECIELGLRPIVIDRGKDVRSRRRDLAMLNKQGQVNPESNYCFGEGGAGTYSDGKLYTRSNKRGNIAQILEWFVHFGASEAILYEAHPHIGTNKLPQIVTAMRLHIEACGGQVLFNKKMVDLVAKNGVIQAIATADGQLIPANAFILATGHSASDVYELLHRKNWLIEAKPFALGVRVEHPQALIDQCQYRQPAGQNQPRPAHLPAAAYSLVHQHQGRGVFSFCMCPGGIIAPAATSPGLLVVNGWSPSKRNNPYANSGIVVECKPADVVPWMKAQLKTTPSPELETMLGTTAAALHPLLMLRFQQAVERQAFASGGGNFVAPAQRLVDFSTGQHSATLPVCSYVPGCATANLGQVLPPFIHRTLQEGFKAFGKKIPGYYTNHAIVVATESRTSSPVRVPRHPHTLQHPQAQNLYPCGEGAGYAGGIVSAAMDGVRVVHAIAQSLGIATS
ncbi:MAG: FAD-binding protein [Bacteroidetes bacterium]|nr:MAG: FAD-binding protein [Bacteroidota bacterium]